MGLYKMSRGWWRPGVLVLFTGSRRNTRNKTAKGSTSRHMDSESVFQHSFMQRLVHPSFGWVKTLVN